MTDEASTRTPKNPTIAGERKGWHDPGGQRATDDKLPHAEQINGAFIPGGDGVLPARPGGPRQYGYHAPNLEW